MPDRRVTLAGLGAWVLKGNADQADLRARFQCEPRVESWCVQPGYRTRMMAAGQPVVFWASGSRGSLVYGVWGFGVVSGPAGPQPEARAWRVPVDLTIMAPDRWIPRLRLRADPRLAGAEVLLQPQGANPSFLSAQQYAALDELADQGGQ